MLYYLFIHHCDITNHKYSFDVNNIIDRLQNYENEHRNMKLKYCIQFNLLITNMSIRTI